MVCCFSAAFRYSRPALPAATPKSAILRKASLALRLLAPAQARVAAKLDIGLSADVASMDPHYHNVAPGNGMAKQVFGTLIRLPYLV